MRRFDMVKKQNQYNHITITHVCGSSFVLDPQLTVDIFDQGYTLRCLHCFKKIDDEAKNQIWQFCQKYLETFEILSKKGLQLTVI